VDIKSVDKASGQSNQPTDQLGSKMLPPRSWIPPRYGRPELLNSLFLIDVAIETGLKCRLQSALIAFRQRNEPERLLCAADGHKHFYSAEHLSPVCVKHQVDNGTLVHRCRQEQQAAIAGNNVQFAKYTEAILELKDSRGCLRETKSRNTPILMQLGRKTHLPQYVTQSRCTGDYGRACTFRVI
jgi:hypothetical protein